MRDKYGVLHDVYCYADSDVLINFLNIKDADKLAEAEAAFSAARYRNYQSAVTSLGQLTLAHLQQLHHYLFQDVYSWAGQLRTVDISKGTTRFCNCQRIKPEADKLMLLIPALAQINNKDAMADAMADLYCELNMLHPFRDGNGRAQRFFFEEMAFLLDYEILWPPLLQQDWVKANVAGVNLDLGPLQHIFRQALVP
ncbi:cell filamentation protein Fic [Arsukibacterium ikkense]|uniref:protein adenylyltransferase n=1 Tax=Arsukibacterium ikkense TaxID=336831 RepID=A0A0M2V5C5_9GAMM|nr:Fic family protein [Arsukibacterium ikkense]KKO44840.1 cell filamentation protein Fic [Arsukibacterium ikkense]